MRTTTSGAVRPVDDVGASADAAVNAGGTITATRIDPEDANRRAVIADPEGAVIGLCPRDDDQTIALTEGVGTVWWAEVLSNNPSLLQEFYHRLFGWQFTSSRLRRIRVTLCGSGREVGWRVVANRTRMEQRSAMAGAVSVDDSSRSPQGR